MSGPLANICASEFLFDDQQRGDQTLSQAKIHLEKVGNHGVIALAVGSQGELHEIYIDFSQLKNNAIGLYCDCPRFADGLNCKHLWATLGQLDHDYDFDLSLISASDFYVYECDPNQISIGRPAPTNHSSKQKTLRSQKKTKNNSPAPWLSQLRTAVQVAQSKHTLRQPTTSTVLSTARYWFGISLPDLSDSYRFPIRLFQSKRKKNGDWSIPTKTSLSKSNLAAIGDPDQRRLFSLLEWDLTNHYNYYSPLLSECSEFHLTADLLPDTLAALCATGRFVWTLDSARKLEDSRPIAADIDLGPWRFFLQVHPTEHEETLRVVPLLRRNDGESQSQMRDLQTVVGICDSGALLFEEQIGYTTLDDARWVRGWQRTGELNLPRNDLSSFLSALFQWENSPEILFSDPLESQLGIQQTVGQPTGKLKLAIPEQNSKELTADIYFKYANSELPAANHRKSIWDPETQTLTSRNPSAETKLLADLQNFAFHESPYRYDDCKLRIHRKWFSDLVRKLTRRGWEVVSEGKLIRSAGSFNIQVTSGEDWFDLDAQIDFDGIQTSLPTLLQAFRQGENHILLDDGSHGMLPEEWLRRFASLSETGQVEGESVRFGRNQALLLDMLLAEQEEVTVDRNFSSLCKRLKKFSGIKPAKQPRGFQGTLRKYQLEGLGWLRFLHEFGFGGCLADDMGLGKTVQVLALLESRRIRRLKKDEVRKPSLAIVPKSLVFNWIDEAAKFTPKLKIIDYTGNTRSGRLAEIESSHLVVTTYATYRIDVEKLKDIQFDYAVLDESQAIKNPRALASKAVRLIQADHRLAMTGTPIENHLGDLWSQFDFLNPGMLGNSTMNQLTLSTEDDNQRLQALGDALRPFILRRTKEQVLKELPAKSEQTLLYDMPPKQKKLYQELRNHYRASLNSKVKEVGIKRAKIHVLEALLRLRQAACDPRLIDPKQKIKGSKIGLLIEQLEDVISEGHKVLVFSQFTSLLGLVQEELDKKDWNYAYLDGKTTRRDECVKKFQEDADCPLFLISMKAGGHGLNLTAADYVYILDPWWNPAVEAQAIDRAHRMGQQNPVMAYRIIARDTVEEKIIQLQQSKRQLADAIISADQSLIRQLTLEDLQVLFD